MSCTKLCQGCPRQCGIDRSTTTGFCHINNDIWVSSFSVHHGEEPPLSGIKGVGNIFMTGCNLACVFCQNYPISQFHYGKEYSLQETVKQLLYLQNKQQVHHIIFVTPSHVIPQIKKIIIAAKKEGLHVPIGYNSNGYDNVKELQKLEGFIDIYLPDFKYFDDTLAIRYSSAPNYKTIATSAIQEMIRQVGPLHIHTNGLATKGVLIRHLILPSHTNDSIAIFAHIKQKWGITIPISLMNQYFPTYHVLDNPNYAEINRTLTPQEYATVLKTYHTMGFSGYYQTEGEGSC